MNTDKMITPKVFVFLFALVFLSLEKPAFAIDPSKFPIVLYMEGNAARLKLPNSSYLQYMDTAFKTAQDLGFNAVRPTNTDPSTYPSLLNLAVKYNLKLILDPCLYGNWLNSGVSLEQIKADWANPQSSLKQDVLNQISVYKGHSAFLGYALADEPAAEKMAYWAFARDALKELDPSHGEYSTFTQTYVQQGEYNLNSVNNALSYGVSNFALENYPFSQDMEPNTMHSDDEYKQAVGWYRLQQTYHDAYRLSSSWQDGTMRVIPILQGISGGDCSYRFPLPTEYQTAVNTSLASGAKGIMVFALEGDGSYQGLFKRSGVTGLTANNLKLVNAIRNVNVGTLQSLGGTLNSLKQDVVIGVRGLGGTEAGIISSRCYDANSGRYWLAANKNPKPSAAPVLQEFGVPVGMLLEDMATKEQFIPTASKASIELKSGSFRILREYAPATAQISVTVKGSSGFIIATPTISSAVGISRVTYLVDGNQGGSQTQAPFGYSIDSTALVNGEHSVRVEVLDVLGRVAASPDVKFTVTNLPDMVVSSLSVSPSTPSIGDSVTINAIIKNKGTAPTPYNTPVGAGFTFNGEWFYSSSTEKGQTVPGPLAPGESAMITCSKAWKLPHGTTTITANADDMNSFLELSESNNSKSLSLNLSIINQAAGPERLAPGYGLLTGTSIKSSDGRFSLVMQKEGNLVLYQLSPFASLWSSPTAGKTAYGVLMQSDGNLVIYDPYWKPLWSTQTCGNPGAYLRLQDDGNLVIYSANNVPLWSTSTWGH